MKVPKQTFATFTKEGVSRKLDTSPNHTPLYNIAQGKCLMHFVFDFPKVSPTAPPHEQLTYYRQVRGFSKEELGALIGVPMGEIVNYEKRSQEIYYEQAEKLAEALNIDVELLLDDYTRFVSPGFGQRIKEIRASLGFTQQKYAELLGVGRCLISIWEIELHRPSRKNYLKILESKAGSERSV